MPRYQDYLLAKLSNHDTLSLVRKPLYSPRTIDLLGGGRWMDAMFLTRPLGSILSSASLPQAPARLLGPMAFDEAQRRGEQGQREYLESLLAETWWREGVDEFRVLATRVPAQWGSEFHLHRDSMNPVMTARLMRAGRLAHRSPHVRGLYLTGSSTHPGQWVSFCAISGILAANCVIEDSQK